MNSFQNVDHNNEIVGDDFLDLLLEDENRFRDNISERYRDNHKNNNIFTTSNCIIQPVLNIDVGRCSDVISTFSDNAYIEKDIESKKDNNFDGGEFGEDVNKLDSDDEDNIGLAYLDTEINSDIDDELEEALNIRIAASKKKNEVRKAGYIGVDKIPEYMKCTEKEYGEMMTALYKEVEDDIPNSPTCSEDEENESESGIKRYPHFNHNVEAKDIKFEVGYRFESKDKFRQAVIDYGVANGFGIIFTRSEARRIQARCNECTWYIWASKMSKEESWQIKSYVWQHTCKKVFAHKYFATYRWIAMRFGSKITSKMTAKELKQLVKDETGLDLRIGKCKLARTLALELHDGSFVSQFNELENYSNEIRRSNPGSTLKLDCDDIGDNSPRKFKRYYVCLKALKEGFKDGCRPLIGLDGCFLKGVTNGQLLCALGKDANNGMYPIAWAIVEVENTSSWDWFVSLLKEDLELVDGNKIVITSDQNTALLGVIKNKLPRAEHRHCAIHIWGNLRKRFGGLAFKIAFWKCVKSQTPPELDLALEELALLNVKAKDFVCSIDPMHWSRAHFGENCKSDIVDNNVCESFNSTILYWRDKPVITMLEGIRTYVMTRIMEQKELAEKRYGELMPRPAARIELNKEKCLKFLATRTRSKYQVSMGLLDTYSVDVQSQSCSCRGWSLSGIPCPHACAAILDLKHDPEDYVVDHYKKATQMRIYSHFINPCNGSKMWIKGNHKPIDPPAFKKMPGRPSKKRFKSILEQNPRKISKIGGKSKCSKCKIMGHNSRGCKNFNPIVEDITNNQVLVPPPQCIEVEPPSFEHFFTVTSDQVSKRGRGRPKKCK